MMPGKGAVFKKPGNHLLFYFSTRRHIIGLKGRVSGSSVRQFHLGGSPGSSPSLPATDGRSAGVSRRLLELESTPEFIQITAPRQRRKLHGGV
jgi:hypothetical protein